VHTNLNDNHDGTFNASLTIFFELIGVGEGVPGTIKL